MQQFINTLDTLSLGGPRTALNLTVFPLFLRSESSLDYQTLSEALASGGARVRELSQSGVVSEIRLENRSSKPILILDGEELVGAKQNRTANVTILAPAGKATRIPVTCIEAGRWSAGPTEFAAAERVHYSRGRARKMETVACALETRGSRQADQGMVWSDIARKSERLGVRSPTGALSDAFEQHSTTVSDYVRRLAALPGQAGAVFAIDGRIEGLELFDSDRTFAKMFPKLVRSYALDAMETAGGKFQAPGTTEATEMLEALRASPVSAYPAVGLGEELRIDGDGVIAGGLIVDDTLVHLVAFAKQRGDAGRTTRESQILRARSRRQVL